MPDPLRRRAIVEIQWKTLFKIIAAVGLVWLWIKLYQITLLVVVAVVLAVTLEPIVAWMERRRVPRWGAATIVSFALLALVSGFLWMTWSSLSTQAGYASQHFAAVWQQIQDKLPDWVRESIESGSGGGDVTSSLAPTMLGFLKSVTTAIIVAILALFLTIYLLIEGGQTRAWLIAFVPRAQRAKVGRTLDECRTAIFAYMAGNVATSICAFVFVFVALSLMNVPAALFLAVLAGVMDFVPVLGFILSSVPGVILALTVSSRSALVVLLLYVAYHTAENYLIAPYVYGDRLKLSNVVVILAFAVGAELAGVIGALIALPIAAMYPAIERIWLRDKLANDTVREHTAIERKAG